MAVVIDGFITTVSALIASRLQPEISSFCIFSTLSAEPGHKRVLDGIPGRKCGPLLDWGLRLGTRITVNC
jgi:nicotinate-nucleotide--dimethylbenzimidazole phosphoribosyltransferase